MALKSRPASAPPSRPLDIVVGGAGDRLFGCARRYAEALAADHPEREVIYLPQGRRRALLRALRSGRTPNLIGHSWGAADVGWALERTGPDRPVGLVIGVDPVGKPGPWRACGAVGDPPVVMVRGTGSEGRLLDGNLTAWLGRTVGHDSPPAFAAPQTFRIDAPFAHYDMTRMMRHPGEDGRSAQDWLLFGRDAASLPKRCPAISA